MPSSSFKDLTSSRGEISSPSISFTKLCAGFPPPCASITCLYRSPEDLEKGSSLKNLPQINAATALDHKYEQYFAPQLWKWLKRNCQAVPRLGTEGCFVSHSARTLLSIRKELMSPWQKGYFVTIPASSALSKKLKGQRRMSLKICLDVESL